MPTYEYECSKCGGTFEAFQSMKDDPLTDCKLPGGCGAKGSLKRLIGSGSGIIFKGSGFYSTDYRSGGGASKTESKSAESKKEASGGGGGCCCGGGGCSH